MMKKVSLKDLNGKIIESYFASDHPKNFPTNMESHTVEDVPSDANWFDMTGGEMKDEFFKTEGYTDQYKDPDHPLNKHDEGQTYHMNEQDVNENSAGGGAHAAFAAEGGWPPNYLPKGYEQEGKGKIWAAFTKSFLNKAKSQESESQIKIDDTIPSDFIDTLDLHLASIYVVAGLGLTAKFMGSFSTTVPDGNKILLLMKRHGTVFYVEESQLLKATKQEVDNYLNEPF